MTLLRAAADNVPLEQICERIDYGYTASASAAAIGPKFLRITDIQDGQVDWSTVPYCQFEGTLDDKATLRPGDIVFARTGATTGKSYLIRDCPHNCVFASYLIRVRPSLEVDPRYLSYFFRTPQYWRQISRSSTGTAQEGVNASKLKQLQVPLPPLDEQLQISEIFDKAYNARENRRLSVLKASQLIPEIFQEMFEDFTQYPETELSKVCAFITKGTTPKSTEILASCESGDVPFLKVYHILDTGAVDFDYKPSFVSSSLHNGLLKRSRVFPGDVLMNIVGPPLGKIGIVPGTFPEWNINQALAIFRATEVLNPVYLLHALRHPTILSKILAKAAGIRQLNLSLEQCREWRIPLPPLSKQQEFANKAETVNALERSVAFALTQQDHLLQSLQSSLFGTDATDRTEARALANV